MIKITAFQTERSVRNGVVMSFNQFEELADKFKDCIQGEKFGSGFTRGELSPPEREDKNATDSRLLIIDGDEGKKGRNAPAPKDVHEALVKLGYNHFIFTTHSHGKGKNKYRVVIESTEYRPKDTKQNNTRILEQLGTMSIFIKHVKEMDAWSQIWFDARRRDEDGLYEFYKYTAGKAWRSIDVKETEAKEEASKAEEGAHGGTESLKSMYEAIREGKNVWPNLRDLAWKRISDGMLRAEVIADMENLLETSHMRIERPDDWQARMNDVERMVDGAIAKVDNESGNNIDISNIVIGNITVENVPPPEMDGLLGQFIDELMEFMEYRDRTLAFVSAIFILSSICSRKFNVDINDKDGMGRPSALNLYITLAAETGIGKSEIEDAVERCDYHFSTAGSDFGRFFFKGKVYTDRTLLELMENQRSLGFLSNEAGLEGQSKLGNKEGLKQAWLNLYGQGAWTKKSGAIMLTGKDTSIKSMKSPCATRLGESTPIEIKKFWQLDNNVENGLVPRECVYMITDPVTDCSYNIRTAFSDNIAAFFRHLLGECSPDVGGDTVIIPHIIHPENNDVMNQIKEHQDKWRKNSVDMSLPKHERAMSTRLHVKCMRYSGLITVINKWGTDLPLVLTKDVWEQGCSIAYAEHANMHNIVSLTSGDSVMDNALDYIVINIGKMLSGEIKNNDGKLDPQDRRKGLVMISKIRKVCKSSAELKELEGDPSRMSTYKTGLDKVIDHMENIGYIINSMKGKRSAKLKITELFTDHIDELSKIGIYSPVISGASILKK